MARFIGIDWDHNSLYLTSGSIGRRDARVERALIWQEPHTLDLAAAEEAGKRLRLRLKEAKLAPAPVLACIGRERVIFKEIRLPVVDAKQEPALVQFQAAKELTEPANRVIIDYTPSQLAAGPERVMLVSIMRRQWLQTLQALCKGAGLTLACATPRSYGISRCLRQSKDSALAAPAPPAGASVAVLTVSKQWAEFTILRDGEVRLARPLAVNDNLLEDVRRNLALYANQNQAAGRDAVQALYFAGANEHAAMQERLREALAIPVHTLDPFADEEQVQVADDRGGFAGLVGLARLWAEQRVPINFVAPKEPKPESRSGARMGVLVAALLVVLLLGGVVIGNSMLTNRQKEVANRQQDLKDMGTQLEKLKPDQQKLAALIQWDQTALHWVDELLEVTQRFPQEKGFYATQLNATQLQTPVGAKNFLMRLNIKGMVPLKKTQLIYQLIDGLNQNPYFQAKREQTKEGAKQGDTAANNEEFEISILMAKQPTEAETTKTAAQGWPKTGASKKPFQAP